MSAGGAALESRRALAAADWRGAPAEGGGVRYDAAMRTPEPSFAVEATPEPSFAVEATPETFDEVVLGARGELVVVEFWGPNCPNCEAFARAEPGLVAALAGARWRFVKVDAYAHDGLARRFGLYGIPAFLLFLDGKLLGKMSRFTSREHWLAVVRERLPAA